MHLIIQWAYGCCVIFIIIITSLVLCLSYYIIWQKMFSPVSFHFPAVLVEWVQAAHLQGQDDPDHKVWNQGYKSKYVELKDEAGNRE